jgi:cell wall assembly regulator SMI1
MPENILITRLEPFLNRIQTLLEEVDRIEKPAAQDKTKPYPAASEAQIVEREKALNFRFPPAYRAFLKIHNGWRGFPFDVAIFGVSGPGYIRPAKDLAGYLKIFERTFRRQGRSHIEDLKRRERTDPDVIYMPEHVALATDFNGIFTVFDHNRPMSDGEFEIAEVSSGQYVEGRFRGFQKLLDDAYKRARSSLIELGVDPDEVESSVADVSETDAISQSKQRKKTQTKPTRGKSS